MSSPPPADAVVLFDGTSLDAWMMADSSAAAWRRVGDAFEVAPGTGTLKTRQAFGDVQLHIEWMSPNPPVGEDQDRGNSGVFFGGGRYEVQILDSYQSATYPDGQAAALYGQYPPRVNASRKPGEWRATTSPTSLRVLPTASWCRRDTDRAAQRCPGARQADTGGTDRQSGSRAIEVHETGCRSSCRIIHIRCGSGMWVRRYEIAPRLLCGELRRSCTGRPGTVPHCSTLSSVTVSEAFTCRSPVAIPSHRSPCMRSPGWRKWSDDWAANHRPNPPV